VTNIEISMGLSGLQVLREGGHELVTLGERRAGLLRSFVDEDLHPRKGAMSFGVGGTAQLIHGSARDLGDGIYAQDRSAKALDRIPRAKVVWLRMARGRVVEVAMVRHRRPQARPGCSRMPSQVPSGLRSAWMGLRFRR